MSAADGPAACTRKSAARPHLDMRCPLRRRNKSSVSSPRGGGTPRSKKSRDVRSASAAASPPSLLVFASPASLSPPGVSLDSPNAAAACVCSASLASSFLECSRSGSSPPGSSGSGAEYSMKSPPPPPARANGTAVKPTYLAAAAAAAAGVAACPVSMSSSSTVIPSAPLGPSAASPTLRPCDVDCEVADFIASSSSSLSPYRPSAEAPRHRSAPRGGMAISLRHRRSNSTFRMMSAPSTSAPGSCSRTPLPGLFPGVTWCHRRSDSASVTLPRSAASSAPAPARHPTLTPMELSSSSVAPPPASGWCGIKSKKGTSARNFCPVVRRVIHTARLRTTPIDHRRSSRVKDPPWCRPGLRWHRLCARLQIPPDSSWYIFIASACRALYTSAAYVPARARSTGVPSAGWPRVRRYGPHADPVPRCSFRCSCSSSTASACSGLDANKGLRCSPTWLPCTRKFRALMEDSVSEAGTRSTLAPASRREVATSPRPSPAFPGTKVTLTPSKRPPLLWNHSSMVAYLSSTLSLSATADDTEVDADDDEVASEEPLDDDDDDDAEDDVGDGGCASAASRSCS
mmetsp:Transcript_27831/g.69853  ORF Transcript_27831/g.69853 Transcript_27831/m.69853 type:complete len:573 (-) Transcript_27831:1124-2842(-)